MSIKPLPLIIKPLPLIIKPLPHIIKPLPLITPSRTIILFRFFEIHQDDFFHKSRQFFSNYPLRFCFIQLGPRTSVITLLFSPHRVSRYQLGSPFSLVLLPSPPPPPPPATAVLLADREVRMAAEKLLERDLDARGQLTSA